MTGRSGPALKIVSAGSTAMGLRAAAAAFTARPDVEIVTDHGHLICEAIRLGQCKAAIAIIPMDMVVELDNAGLIAKGQRAGIGATGIGYASPAAQSLFSITDDASLTEAVMAADKLFVTTAPTGRHMLMWLERLGLQSKVVGKLRSFDRATEMLAELARETPNVLAFGPTTELAAWRDKGVAYCGPVPSRFDLPLEYGIAMLKHAQAERHALELFAYLAGPQALACFRASGVL